MGEMRQAYQGSGCQQRLLLGRVVTRLLCLFDAAPQPGSRRLPARLHLLLQYTLQSQSSTISIHIGFNLTFSQTGSGFLDLSISVSGVLPYDNFIYLAKAAMNDRIGSQLLSVASCIIDLLSLLLERNPQSILLWREGEEAVYNGLRRAAATAATLRWDSG